MSVGLRFSEAELAAVREATAGAERESGIEIVAVVVERADDYEEAIWLATAAGALLGAVIAALARLTAGGWIALPAVGILLPPMAGAAVGYLLTSWFRGLRRSLVREEVLERRVRRRAAELFLEEEVFATVDRTGVLLLVALFERRAVVLADRGIDSRVPGESWEGISDRLADGIRAGHPGRALIEAIEECRRLAAEYGVARRKNDRNELADDVRFPDE